MKIRDTLKQIAANGFDGAKKAVKSEARTLLGNQMEKLTVRVKTGQFAEGGGSNESINQLPKRLALRTLQGASRRLKEGAGMVSQHSPQPPGGGAQSLSESFKRRVTPFVLEQTAHVLDHAAGRIENPDTARPSSLESFVASAQGQLHELAHQAKEQAKPAAMNVAAQGFQHLSDGFGVMASKFAQAPMTGESAEVPKDSPPLTK